MKTKSWIVSIVVMAGSFAAEAQAHVGVHGTGLTAGMMHPFSGLDHLLAMIAVGAWAVQQGGRARWAVPLAFVAMIAAGGAWGSLGGWLPGIESGIAASVLVLGLLIAFSARLPVAAGVALVGGFALFHGYAHGAEMPAIANAWLYALGFVLSTALLHAAGLGMGLAMKARLVRLGGAGLAFAGLWMLAGI